jgi:hypothetical protein
MQAILSSSSSAAHSSAVAIRCWEGMDRGFVRREIVARRSRWAFRIGEGGALTSSPWEGGKRVRQHPYPQPCESPASTSMHASEKRIDLWMPSPRTVRLNWAAGARVGIRWGCVRS